MLTRILHNSPALCTFLDQLGLQLSQPQRKYIANIADALLVCENVKTLSALQRQLIEASDVSNMADFLRISPWCAQDVRVALRRSQIEWLLNEAEQRNLPKVLYINLDDSIGQKHKDTRHLEPVDWHYDHTESSKRRPRFKNGICYLACTVAVGPRVVTVDLRLYLRTKTVRRINRRRGDSPHVSFRSKNSLARHILSELRQDPNHHPPLLRRTQTFNHISKDDGSTWKHASLPDQGGLLPCQPHEFRKSRYSSSVTGAPLTEQLICEASQSDAGRHCAALARDPPTEPDSRPVAHRFGAFGRRIPGACHDFVRKFGAPLVIVPRVCAKPVSA